MVRRQKTRKDGLEGDDAAIGEEYTDEESDDSIELSENEGYDGELLETNEDIVSYNRYVNVNVIPKELEIGKKDAPTNYAKIPGFPHVGPGNPIYPWATNDLDNIARTHDIEYGLAKTPFDVIKADEKFLKAITEHEPKNIQEWFTKQVGKIGIQAKYSFEKQFGMVYPTFDKEFIDKLREQDPKFRELEEKWQKNTTKTLTDSAIHGLSTSWRHGNKNVLFEFAKNKSVKWTTGKDFRADVMFHAFKTQHQTRINGQRREWFEKNYDRIDNHVMEFLKVYDKDVIQPLIKEYVKHKPMSPENEEFRNIVLNLDKHADKYFREYIKHEWLDNYEFQFGPETDELLSKYLNKYSEGLYRQIEELDDINYAMDNETKRLNYEREVNNLNKQFGEQRVQAELNTLVKGGKVVGKQLHNLEKLYKAYQQSKQAYEEYQTSNQFTHDNPYQFTMQQREKRAIKPGEKRPNSNLPNTPDNQPGDSKKTKVDPPEKSTTEVSAGPSNRETVKRKLDLDGESASGGKQPKADTGTGAAAKSPALETTQPGTSGKISESVQSEREATKDPTQANPEVQQQIQTEAGNDINERGSLVGESGNRKIQKKQVRWGVIENGVNNNISNNFHQNKTTCHDERQRCRIFI